MYGETDAHPSGYGQGNGGFSGTPLWKLQQQNHHKAMVLAAQQAYLDEQEAVKAEKLKLDKEREKGRRLLVDAAVHANGQPQKLVRHVLVKDLRKVAGALNMQLPTQGVFGHGGQRALFALFDCQAAEVPDPKVAETCCRQLPVTMLRNVCMLPAQNCIPAFVKAALLKSFEDLERDLSASGIGKQCAASVVLVVGDWLFSAVLGRCNAVLFQEPLEGSPQHVATPLAAACAGTSAAGAEGTGAQPPPREALGVPEVSGVQLEVGAHNPFIILTGLSVARALTTQEIQDISMRFLHKPRAASGEIVARACDRVVATERPADEQAEGDAAAPPASCAAVVAFFRKPDEDTGAAARRGVEASAAKRPRVEAPNMESVRLRHIVVRHKDCKYPIDPLKNKPATRTPVEAEAILRDALAELLKDGDHKGDSKWAAQSTPRIMKVIREISECKSALKGGSQCGDLGWLGKKELERLGKDSFAEPVRALHVAEWSDVLHSEQGTHLVMRIA